MDPLIERFLRFVSPEPNSGCWLWEGALSGTEGRGAGYGRFSIRGMTYAAHRVSHELFIGPLKKWHQVDHKCKTRCCVNPDHIEKCTNLENQRRKVKRNKK